MGEIEYGRLETEYRYPNPVTREWEAVEYHWVGNPIALVDRRMLRGALGHEPKPGQRIMVGPYRVLVQKHDWRFFDLVLIREDSYWWRFRYWLHMRTRILDLAYRRFIVTLAVWRLARYQQNTIPTADDIFAVARLKRKWNGRKEKP